MNPDDFTSDFTNKEKTNSESRKIPNYVLPYDVKHAGIMPARLGWISTSTKP